MAEPNPQQLLANTLSVVAVLLMSSGILVNTLPLESRRPADSERAVISHAGRQDVEARLWQDPFTVMQTAKGKMTGGTRCDAAIADTDHHPATLSRLLARRARTDAITVLPVLVPGGPYFEDGEARRRARYAVTTALLGSGWDPSDGDKLGYVWTFESCMRDPWLRWAPEILPWEWFSRAPNEQSREGLLILWVEDAVVSRHPLRSMNEIVKGLMNGGVQCPDPAPQNARQSHGFPLDQSRVDALRVSIHKSNKKPENLCPDPTKLPATVGNDRCPDHQQAAWIWRQGYASPRPWCATRVLGPWTSDGLQGLLRDIESPPPLAPHHDWLRFYSSAATAHLTPDILLPPMRPLQGSEKSQESKKTHESKKSQGSAARNPPKPQEPSSPAQERFDQIRPWLEQRLLRLTTTDDQLAGAFVSELALRLTDPSPFWRLFHRGGEAAVLCTATVVTVSENENSYPRLFAAAFRESLPKDCNHASENAAQRDKWPPPLLAKTYLRGLDGVVPDGTSAPVPPTRPASGAPAPRPDALLKDAPRERADGRGQYDYLRRLAEDLTDVDARARRDGGAGIRAIGLLGNDVYDKILILEAMRPKFPRAVFFTADLDARMMGADVAKWTRNLVVASAYGLTLNPDIQGPAPPFRDTYQTGLYLSTLVALDPKARSLPKVEWFRRPQLFEIGRTRAVPLSAGAVNLCNSVDDSGLRRSLNCDNIHPLDDTRDFSWPSRSAIAAVILTISAAAIFALLMFDGARTALSAIKGSAWMWLAGFAALAAVGAAFGYRIWLDISSHDGPPFAWTEGVSLWPTALLRLVVCAVTLALLWYSQWRLSRALVALSKHFELPARSDGTATAPAGGRGWLHRVAPLWAFDSSDAEHPWPDFLRRMSVRERITRTAVTSVLFSLFSLALLSGDWPHALHRGAFSAWVGHVTLVLVLLSLAALLAVALDTSAMAAGFVERLGRQVETMEILETAPREAWLRMPMETAVTQLVHRFRFAMELGMAVNTLMYLPFVALLLTVATRAILLEVVALPVAYAVLFGVASLIAVFCAVRLRRAMGKMRAIIVDKLNEHIEGYVLQGELATSGPDSAAPTGEDSSQWTSLPPQSKAARIRALRDKILEQRAGPLQPFHEDPVVRAILLLLGGAGAISTAQFLFLTGGN